MQMSSPGWGGFSSKKRGPVLIMCLRFSQAGEVSRTECEMWLATVDLKSVRSEIREGRVGGDRPDD